MMKTTRRSLISGGATLAGLATAAVMGSEARESRAQGQETTMRNALTEVDGDTNAPLALPERPTTRRGDMLYRKLGRTGEEVSLIGMGGFHLGIPKTAKEAVDLVHAAVDRGINFLDNCWDYNNGESELRMGTALSQNGYRSKVFLMTKIDGRTKQAAMQQIDESLQRLRTDHVDLLQFHEILRMEDPDRVFAPDGALEAAIAAKQAGKLRYIGFTGHKDPFVHLRMLATADQHGFHFDTVQMPVNVMDAHFRSFQRQVLPVLVQKEIGALAMKTFGDHHILDHVLANGLAKPVEMLHYSMSLPVSVVITGIDRKEILDQAFEAAKTFQPMTAEQVRSLLSRTKEAAVAGKYELFKTQTPFDSTAKHPEWLG